MEHSNAQWEMQKPQLIPKHIASMADRLKAVIDMVKYQVMIFTSVYVLSPFTCIFIPMNKSDSNYQPILFKSAQLGLMDRVKGVNSKWVAWEKKIMHTHN